MKFNNHFQEKSVTDQLDFFKEFYSPAKTNVTIWFLLSLFASFSIFSSLMVIQKKKRTYLTFLKKKENKFLHQNEDFKDKLHALHSLESINNNLNNHLNNLTKIKTHKQTTLPKVLKAISFSIHKQTWLSRIKITNLRQSPAGKTIIQTSNNNNIHTKTATVLHKKTNIKLNFFEIQAKTKNGKEIMKLVNGLSHNPLLKNIKLTNLQKIKPNLNRHSHEPPSLYNFFISGQVAQQNKPVAKSN